MSRTMPQECPHGKIQTWGDFGSEDGSSKRQPCPECEQERADAAHRFELAVYGEVAATSAHTNHDGRCRCQWTVDNILQRMRAEPDMVYAWLTREREGSGGRR